MRTFVIKSLCFMISVCISLPVRAMHGAIDSAEPTFRAIQMLDGWKFQLPGDYETEEPALQALTRRLMENPKQALRLVVAGNADEEERELVFVKAPNQIRVSSMIVGLGGVLCSFVTEVSKKGRHLNAQALAQARAELLEFVGLPADTVAGGGSGASASPTSETTP